jgi:hypothetical protein
MVIVFQGFQDQSHSTIALFNIKPRIEYKNFGVEHDNRQ